MVKADRTETYGPTKIARPKGNAATTRGASKDPTIMPTP